VWKWLLVVVVLVVALWPISREHWGGGPPSPGACATRYHERVPLAGSVISFFEDGKALVAYKRDAMGRLVCT
jgi:hypothetical protein